MGGVRWWFLCTLTCDGRYCGRRVGKLYLPPGGRYYGCRHCYDLTYKSCQLSHKYERSDRIMASTIGVTYEEVCRMWCDDDKWEDRAKRNEQRRPRRKAKNWT